MGAVRFSLGRSTTWEELADVLSMLGAATFPTRAATATADARS
jgi:hypothetical protein